MLTIQVIKKPSRGTVRLLQRRVYDQQVKTLLEKSGIDAVGLLQGQVAELIAAGNVAEKAARVEIAEVTGSCPQHMTVIGIFGETSAVTEAVKAVELWLEHAKR